jgi:hypothetical protein
VAPSPRSSGPKVPLFGTSLGLPSRGSLAWYVGLGAMTALEVIDWPLAIIVATSHALTDHTRNPAARELGEGTETAA